MNVLSERQVFFYRSAHRFAEHYRLYAQTYQSHFSMLGEELENIFYALNTYKHEGMWSDIIYFVLILDAFLETRGYWGERRFWLEQVVDHNEVFDDLKIQMQIFQSLAEVTAAQGNLNKAEQLYWKVINLAKETDDKTYLGPTYFCLYSLYQKSRAVG